MCIICFVKNGVILTEEEVENMWDSNPHGVGYSYYDKSSEKWIMKKGVMKLKDLLDDLKNNKFIGNKNHPNMVIHFRYATHGGLLEELTHPFKLKLKDREGYLFHNGVFDTQSEIETVNGRYTYYRGSGLKLMKGESDTSAFTRLLNELELTTDKLVLLLQKGGLLDGLINGSKVAITLDGIEEPLLFGPYSEYEGKIVSNTYSIIRTPKYNYYKSSGTVQSCEIGENLEKKNKKKKREIEEDDYYLSYDKDYLGNYKYNPYDEYLYDYDYEGDEYEDDEYGDNQLPIIEVELNDDVANEFELDKDMD